MTELNPRYNSCSYGKSFESIGEIIVIVLFVELMLTVDEFCFECFESWLEICWVFLGNMEDGGAIALGAVDAAGTFV